MQKSHQWGDYTQKSKNRMESRVKTMNGKAGKGGKKHYTPRELFTFVLLGIVVALVIIAIVLAIVKGNKKPEKTDGKTQEKVVTQTKAPEQTRDPNKEPGDIEVDVNDLPD